MMEMVVMMVMGAMMEMVVIMMIGAMMEMVVMMVLGAIMEKKMSKTPKSCFLLSAMSYMIKIQNVQ